ncbi:MAG TPA: hypothetical protein VHC22_18175 [Pirellulales bacterium]|nr:hypothetical protein [Pirellulales bacterium]
MTNAAKDTADRRLYADPKTIGDAVLLCLLVAVAFLLACYKETDNDIWWHLAGGEWILSHCRVPDLDPFTFASQERTWIDLHWLFEVAAALAFRAAAMPGVVCLAAGLSAATVAVALTMRKRTWPLPTVIACWVPALALIGWRLPPRPELCTLLFLAIYLAVLHRWDERPRLVWFLPVVQVLWVNTHGLFVLGPVVMGLWLAARAIESFWRSRSRNSASSDPDVGQDYAWRKTLLVMGAVVAACLVNPYLVRGALFPFELFPKIAASANVYKQTVGEFASLGSWARSQELPGSRSAYFCAAYFLLNFLPASFLLPAVWSAATSNPSVAGRAAQGRKDVPTEDGRWGWLLALACGATLAVISMRSLPGRALSWWEIGRYAPLGWLMLGGAGAAALRQSRVAVQAGLAGSVAMAAWTITLRAILYSRDDLLGMSGGAVWGLAAIALASAAVPLRSRLRLDRVLLAVTFGYLAMQALRNGPLFGLVGGAVLAGNLGEWMADWQRGSRRGLVHAASGLAFKLVSGAAMAFWIFAIVTNRYHDWTRQRREFGFDEAPFVSAHAAARFAGQSGLPTRAVCFNLGQAGVYSFHNGPEHKPFIDARLELPSEDDYRRYLELESDLNHNGPAWPAILADLGNPLVLVLHTSDHAAEAALLSHEAWRCIYFDAVGAVFVSDDLSDLQESFPTVDFGTRHFRHSRSSSPEPPQTVLHEARALQQIGRAISAMGGEPQWALELAALGLATEATREEPFSSQTWTLLANCWASLGLTQDAAAEGDDVWLPQRDLFASQAAFCAARALELPPQDPEALATLYSIYRSAGLLDAQLSVGLSLRHDPATPQDRREEIGRLEQTVQQLVTEQLPTPVAGSAASIQNCLRLGLPMLAVREHGRLRETGGATIDWECTQAAAAAHLKLGQPGQARTIWQAASDVPSEHERNCRIAETYLVEQDLQQAMAWYGEVVSADPGMAAAWWGLALIHAQLGSAEAAFAACQHGLDCDLSSQQRTRFSEWQGLVGRYRRIGQ